MFQKRPLGKTGLEIAPLVLGGNVFGWTADRATSFQILDRFVELGGNLIDTADVYSGFAPGGTYGESERIIGQWMKARKNRDQVIIATKVGYEMAPDKKGLSKKYISSAVEDSLSRLQIETIDLYQSHRDDLTAPIAETLSTYTELIQAGKVKFIGASQCTPERLLESLQTSKKLNLATYSTLQPLYNLMERAGFERNFEALCQEHALGVISFYGLAKGFLTGKYRIMADLAKSTRGSGVKDYLNERGFRVLAALDEIANSIDATPAQIALAWQRSNPAVTAPIASATSVEHLNELWKSATLILSLDAIDLLNRASESLEA